MTTQERVSRRCADSVRPRCRTGGYTVQQRRREKWGSATAATVLVTAAPLSRGVGPPRGRRAPRPRRAARSPTGRTEWRLAARTRLVRARIHQRGLRWHPSPSGRNRPPGGQRNRAKAHPWARIRAGPPSFPAPSGQRPPLDTPLPSFFSMTSQGTPSAPGAASRPTRVQSPVRRSGTRRHERESYATSANRLQGAGRAAHGGTLAALGARATRSVRGAGWGGRATQSMAASWALFPGPLPLCPQ